MSFKKKDPIDPSSVELVPRPGSKQRGGDVGGEAWIIKVDGKRAGTAYINITEDLIRGKHASFHIFINKPNQGRQIGRRVYKLACRYSRYNVIYAHMRKSNMASYKAAIYAGFVNVTRPEEKQLVLAWTRKSN